MFYKSFIVAAGIACLGFGVQPALARPSAGPVTTVYSFDANSGEYLEGLAIDKVGNVYVGLAFLGQVWKFAPDGTPSLFATLDIGQSGAGAIIGLAVDAEGDLYVCDVSDVAETHGIWKVSRDGTPTLFAALPPQTNPFNGITGFGFPNGLAFDEEGNLYVTDSYLAAIWKITKNGKATLWLQDPLLNLLNGFGANGVEFDRGSMFISNTDLGLIVRVEKPEDRKPPRAELFVQDPTLIGADGIAFDEMHNLYVAVDRQNTLIRISPEGTLTTLATASDGLDYPASASFDQRRGTHKLLYFTNAGLIFNTPSLQRLDVGVRGEPLP
jgi:sugar lactone lactonase YvrE